MTTLTKIAELKQSYDALFSSGESNIVNICNIGRDLANQGFKEEANKCFDLAVKCMLLLLNSSKINMALHVEALIFSSFVKIKEDEQHYYQCFQCWTREFQGKARSMSLPPLKPGVSSRVCFVLQAGLLLGHTRVMLSVIDEWRKNNHTEVEIFVAVLSEIHPNFVENLSSRGISLIHYGEPTLNDPMSLMEAIHALRADLQKFDIHTVVWVSNPVCSSYALALPLAPRQFFWSLKFHPVTIPEVQHHICGGHASEKTRIYHGHPWKVVPFPLTVSLTENKPEDIKKIKSQFPKDTVLLGILAREEKYNSNDYLVAVGTILAENPQCHFIFSGRKILPKMIETFTAYSVWERCHFVGWVDTNLYAQVLDIFLESFPFGCAVTGFQAMGHGTPLVSFQATDTVFGYQLRGSLGPDFNQVVIDEQTGESLPILTAATLDHYINLVQRLIDDPVFRLEIGKREQQYYSSESAATNDYAIRLLNLIQSD